MKKTTKPANYWCETCQKPRVYNRKCQKCGSEVVPIQDGEGNTEGPGAVEAKEYEQQIEGESKEIKATTTPKGKPISKKDFKDFFSYPFEKLNKWLDKCPDESKYKELADIWKFEEDEIDDTLEWIYDLLRRIFPKFLIWMGSEGFLILIFNGIFVFLIFGKKIQKTLKLLNQWKKEKKEGMEAVSDGGERQPTTA